MQDRSGIRHRRGERGEGRIGTLIGLIVFAAVCYAGWNVLPLFVTDYAFQDKLNELARANRGTHSDEMILDNVMKEVRTRGLADYISRADVRIQTVETNRRIYVTYQRSAVVLPGWKKTFKFTDDVEQPLLY